MVNRQLATALTLGLLLIPAAHAQEFNGTLRITPEFRDADRSSPYYASGRPEMPKGWYSTQELALRYRGHGISGDATLRWEAREGGPNQTKAVLNELYYDSDLGNGIAWTVGKKVVSWGVGFAFRPLDVIQRENRRTVTEPRLEGIPLLAVEQFTADQAFSAVWTRPLLGGSKQDRYDESIAARWYKMQGDFELHSVVRFSRTRKMEIGIGATQVLSNEWSIYGASLYNHRYLKTTSQILDNPIPFALNDPMRAAAGHHANKTVIGAQWTGVNGWSGLLEIFHDGEAYKSSDWRRLDTLTARQHVAASLVPNALFNANLAWSSQAYTQANLLRDNLLFRVSYDNRDGFKPYLELLNTPADGGVVTTLGANYETNRHKLSFGVRHLGGRSDSAYAQAPLKQMAWLQWSYPLW